MKNFTKLLLGSLVLFSLSGCTAGDMITSYTSVAEMNILYHSIIITSIYIIVAEIPVILDSV